MNWGMKNRLSRLIQSDGRAMFLPIDHGYFQGPVTKLEEPSKTLEPLLPYPDAIMLTRGVLRNCVDPGEDITVILRVSGGTSMARRKELDQEGITTSVREAVRMNVSAVSASVFVGAEHEHQTLLNLSELVNECEEYGIPVMAVTAVGEELEKRDSQYLALASRIAAELGAHVVKTYYCEEGFEEVVRGCPVPIVIAGGPKVESELEVFNWIYDALQKGAIGVNLGRNVWQHEYPVAMAKSVRAVIHEDVTPEEAQEIFENAKGESED